MKTFDDLSTELRGAYDDAMERLLRALLSMGADSKDIRVEHHPGLKTVVLSNGVPFAQIVIGPKEGFMTVQSCILESRMETVS